MRGVWLTILVAGTAAADREHPTCTCIAKHYLTFTGDHPDQHDVVVDLNTAYTQRFWDCMRKHDVAEFDLELQWNRGQKTPRSVRVTSRPANPAFAACSEAGTWDYFAPAARAMTVKLHVSDSMMLAKQKQKQKRDRRYGDL